MPLVVRLQSPAHLYRKLERESYRAFHAAVPLHKADHFYNFCVTAASMRDYMLEHLGKIAPSDKQPYYDAWAKIPVLVTAAEIANSTKHFVLRSGGAPRSPKTRSVRMKKAEFLDIYTDGAGEFKMVRQIRSEVRVILSDGRALQLIDFTHEVLDYWKRFLASNGLKVRRQSFKYLAGK